ncbi:hypothetical protein AB0D54_14610 [Streptomyces xanthophaeus]|uniref:hypothetical protein n=1 Tax=Streptomyces xanthophaeus TaxID=67385 RepID=UPI0034241AF7
MPRPRGGRCGRVRAPAGQAGADAPGHHAFSRPGFAGPDHPSSVARTHDRPLSGPDEPAPGTPGDNRVRVAPTSRQQCDGHAPGHDPGAVGGLPAPAPAPVLAPAR